MTTKKSMCVYSLVYTVKIFSLKSQKLILIAMPHNYI